MSVDKFGRFSDSRTARKTTGKRGPSGNGFILSKDGNFDLNFKSIHNLGIPEQNDDAVNVTFVNNQIEKLLQKMTTIISNSKVELETYIDKQIEVFDITLKKHMESTDEVQNSLKQYIDEEVEKIHSFLFHQISNSSRNTLRVEATGTIEE